MLTHSHPTNRYKLSILAGDETGDTEFVLFGRVAQRLIKKSVDTLIAGNPVGFIPNEITRLLEKVFIWNVSFSEYTIQSGNVSFQVNATIAEIDTGTHLPMSPAGSQQSSLRACLVRVLEPGSYLRAWLIWDRLSACNLVMFG